MESTVLQKPIQRDLVITNPDIWINLVITMGYVMTSLQKSQLKNLDIMISLIIVLTKPYHNIEISLYFKWHSKVSRIKMIYDLKGDLNYPLRSIFIEEMTLLFHSIQE